MEFADILTSKHTIIITDIVMTTVITVILLKIVASCLTTFFKKIIDKTDDLDTIKRLKTTKIVLMSIADVVLISLALLHVLDVIGFNKIGSSEILKEQFIISEIQVFLRLQTIQKIIHTP